MLASGGNDNKMFVYDNRTLRSPLKKYSQHKAAIKALSWSQNSSSLLISGGGTADKTVRMWDISLINNESEEKEPSLIRSVDYGSQVCNLYWTRENEIISTHGYSQNDTRISKASSLKVESLFYGHKNRVIHFAVSQDEKYFVSGSSDSALNFWKIDRVKGFERVLR
jgi:cell division cycle 20-like protein 1 (cofactor of APC complex)